MTHDVDLRMACMLMFIRIPYRHMRIGDPFRLYKPCSLPAQAHTRTLAHINNRKHMRAHTHTHTKWKYLVLPSAAVRTSPPEIEST